MFIYIILTVGGSFCFSWVLEVAVVGVISRLLGSEVSCIEIYWISKKLSYFDRICWLLSVLRGGDRDALVAFFMIRVLPLMVWRVGDFSMGYRIVLSSYFRYYVRLGILAFFTIMKYKAFKHREVIVWLSLPYIMK